MYAGRGQWINMLELSPRFFPAPLPLLDSFQRTPAPSRTEALQGTSPLAHDSFVAAWPVAGLVEKNVA
jgi:hypothetical protein